MLKKNLWDSVVEKFTTQIPLGVAESYTACPECGNQTRTVVEENVVSFVGDWALFPFKRRFFTVCTECEYIEETAKIDLKKLTFITRKSPFKSYALIAVLPVAVILCFARYQYENYLENKIYASVPDIEIGSFYQMYIKEIDGTCGAKIIGKNKDGVYLSLYPIRYIKERNLIWTKYKEGRVKASLKKEICEAAVDMKLWKDKAFISYADLQNRSKDTAAYEIYRNFKCSN